MIYIKHRKFVLALSVKVIIKVIFNYLLQLVIIGLEMVLGLVGIFAMSWMSVGWALTVLVSCVLVMWLLNRIWMAIFMSHIN